MFGTIDSSTADQDILGVEAGDIGYAMLLARHAAAEPITDDMVLRASLRRVHTEATPAEEADSIEPLMAELRDHSGERRRTALVRMFRARS